MRLSVLSLNILAPSLTKRPENLATFTDRLAKIATSVKSYFGDIDVLVFSEVDEYTESQHVYQVFTPLFSHYTLFYLPKPTSVDTSNISVRHGTLIMINNRRVKCRGSFPAPLTDASSIAGSVVADPTLLDTQNQILNILLLEERIDKNRFVLCGVHLKAGTNERSAALRKLQLAEIVKRVNDLSSYSTSAILVGDFNEPQLTIEGFTDVYECQGSQSTVVPCLRTQAVAPELKSANAKDSKDNDTRLDYIFFRNIFHIERNTIVFEGKDIESYDNSNLSDHFPIGVRFVG